MMNKQILESEGFIFGRGLFETMLCKQGRVLFLREHLKRLFAGARKISLKISQPPSDLEKGVYLKLKEAKLTKLENVYVRLNVWAQGKGTQFYVIVKPISPPSKKEYTLGWKVLIPDFTLNENSPLAGVKSLNYLSQLLIRQRAQSKGFNEAVLLNSRGFIGEGTRANIFLVKKNKLLTPDLACGILDGITRQETIKLAGKNQIKVREGNFKLKDLLEADEAFLTNSLVGIMPVYSVNKTILPKLRPLTDKISGFYENYTNAVIGWKYHPNLFAE